MDNFPTWIPGYSPALLDLFLSSANKYYSSAGHHEQEIKKTTGQIKFLTVAIKRGIKLVLWHSLCK